MVVEAAEEVDAVVAEGGALLARCERLTVSLADGSGAIWVPCPSKGVDDWRAFVRSVGLHASGTNGAQTPPVVVILDPTGIVRPMVELETDDVVTRLYEPQRVGDDGADRVWPCTLTDLPASLHHVVRRFQPLQPSILDLPAEIEARRADVLATADQVRGAIFDGSRAARARR